MATKWTDVANNALYLTAGVVVLTTLVGAGLFMSAVNKMPVRTRDGRRIVNGLPVPRRG